MYFYELNNASYCEYKPFILYSETKRDDFSELVEKCFEKAYNTLHEKFDNLDDLDYLNADNFIDEVLLELEKYGMHKIKIEKAVSLGAAIIYGQNFDKPDVIKQEIWDKIVDHNKKVSKRHYKYYKGD